MAAQGFELTRDGRTHRLDVTDIGMSRHYVWLCDDTEVASTKSMDDRLVLKPESGDWGEIRTHGGLAGVRRASLVVGGVEVDLVPDPGSRAARREQRVREHPHLHVVLHTVAALAKVLIPLLGIGLVFSFLPDWNLPSIPWPDWDLPSIPWPDWSLPRFEFEVPAWIRAVLDKLKYVGPVLLAFGLAMREVKRRREQDARRAGADANDAGESSDDDRESSGREGSAD